MNSIRGAKWDKKPCTTIIINLAIDTTVMYICSSTCSGSGMAGVAFAIPLFCA